MKVLVLEDELWVLAKKKIQAELDRTSLNAAMVRGWNKRRHDGTRLWCEAWVRKDHIEAIRLSRILSL
jgi:hypothetical protein